MKTNKNVGLVWYYNKNIVGIDNNDAMVGTYSGVGKSYKWTTKVFVHFIDKGGGRKRFLQFKLNLIQKLILILMLGSWSQ